jgi:hypothetical protein
LLICEHCRARTPAGPAGAGVTACDEAGSGAENVVTGDLSGIQETLSLAGQVNKLGDFDAVIHNAGVGYREPKLATSTFHGQGRTDNRLKVHS